MVKSKNNWGIYVENIKIPSSIGKVTLESFVPSPATK